MSKLTYVKPERIWLRDHPELNEKWVQDRVAEDPSIFDLGDVIVKDRERRQSTGGRLDLLLQDAESHRRYEVEIQLGRTDESHVIRTIEYWDIERKRYPQYDHCAVVVAEDITSRFLNVIGLFNGFIPLMALQMTAISIGDHVGLMFTTVVDELTLGFEDDDEGIETVADRAYWETRGTETTVAIADELLAMIQAFAPDLELKYNKFYIGLARDGRPNNFVVFRPKKKHVSLELRLPQNHQTELALESAGVDLMEYDKRWKRYRLRLKARDVKVHGELLAQLMQQAFRASCGGEMP